MAEQQPYVIREWGEGFWRWSCAARERTGQQHWGIVGRPFKREDAERLAQEHCADGHADPRPSVDLTAADVERHIRLDACEQRDDESGLAGTLVQHVRRASERRRDELQT